MSTSLEIVFHERALAEIEEIDAWWRTNRAFAPDLFIGELERAVSLVALLPGLGAPARNERTIGLRRILLVRTKYHVYYRARADRVEILAVWHASRGTSPGF